MDVTERNLTELAQIESKERYRAVVEAFDGFIYIGSPDYRVEFMNQRLIDHIGRDAVGETCYKVLHDRDSICEWCVNERVFHGETVRWEVQSPKDQRWYYVANTPLRHSDGTISKQSMIMDITERKLAEEALQKSEERFRQVAESVGDFIWEVDTNGLYRSKYVHKIANLAMALTVVLIFALNYDKFILLFGTRAIGVAIIYVVLTGLLGYVLGGSERGNRAPMLFCSGRGMPAYPCCSPPNCSPIEMCSSWQA